MTEQFEQFIERWTHPDYRPEPTPAADLDSVEAEFGTLFPASYRAFLEKFGPVGTTAALLELIVERELDLSDVSEFYEPDGIKSQTLGWRDLGLPAEFVAFAGDCQGNLFCFSLAPSTDGRRPADTSVWYFDHDDAEITNLNVDFTQWVVKFGKLGNRNWWRRLLGT